MRGGILLGCTFRNVDDHFTWAFAGVYGPNFWIGMEGSFGMSWLVCSAGEICFGALRVILMLLDSLVRDWAKLVYAQLWWTCLISFLIRALVGGTFFF